MSSTLKIFVACFSGGIIGGLVALQLHPEIWWLGMVVGFLTGYLTYDFKQVISAVKYVGKSYIPAYFRTLPIRYKFFKYALVAVATIYNGIMAGCIIMYGLIGLAAPSQPKVLKTIMELAEMVIAMNSAPLILVAIFSLVGSFPHFSEIKDAKRRAKEINPIAITKSCVRWGLKIARNTPEFFNKCLTFIKIFCQIITKVFRIIHSDNRLICGVYSAIAASICFFTGNALIGALIGAVLGVISKKTIGYWLAKNPIAIKS
ncbi:MAG: hypothetical protein WCW02_02675 [Candidatus Buchananbacteria bacterium]